MTWQLILLIFLGGGAGSVVRYALGHLLKQLTVFPAATLLANVIAALIIGSATALPIKAQPLWWAFIAIGFCGGLSTFSTFSLDNVQLIQQGQWVWAVANISLSIVLCFGATWIMLRILA